MKCVFLCGSRFYDINFWNEWFCDDAKLAPQFLLYRVIPKSHKYYIICHFGMVKIRPYGVLDYFNLVSFRYVMERPISETTCYMIMWYDDLILVYLILLFLGYLRNLFLELLFLVNDVFDIFEQSNSLIGYLFNMGYEFRPEQQYECEVASRQSRARVANEWLQYINAIYDNAAIGTLTEITIIRLKCRKHVTNCTQ